MTVLVTGATGFVGSHVVARLAQAGIPVRAMARDASRLSPTTDVEPIVADITQPQTLPGAVAGVDTVIHCAALTADIKEPYRGAYDAINRMGTENLVKAAREAGVKRIVAMSGLGTRPAPTGSYMATRWGLEEAVRNSDVPYAIIRPSIQFGAGAQFIAALARLIRRSPVVPLLGGGRLRFQPIWVEDVVTCIEKAIADERLLGAEHTIGGSEYATFREITEVIARVLGKRRLFAPLPLPIARVQAPLMTAVMRHPPLTPASLGLFSFENTTDIDAVDRVFGFHPRGLREHLRAHGVEA
jgi:NADH dehydrogenase